MNIKTKEKLHEISRKYNIINVSHKRSMSDDAVIKNIRKILRFIGIEI